MIISLILLAFGLWFFNYYKKSMFYWHERNVRQGIPVPILGDAWRSLFKLESQPDSIKRLYNRFKNVRYSGIYQGANKTLLIHDPNLIKQITVKDFDHFVDHTNFVGDMEPLWSKNLFARKGNEWKELRATLSPSFTASKMRLMFELMETSARQYVEFYLEKKQNLIELELKESFTRYSSDVIANCAFGITVNSLKVPDNEFYKHGKEITSLLSFSKLMKMFIGMFLPSITKLFKLTFFDRETTDFFKTLVRDTVSTREEKNIVRPDMINLLIEARQGHLKYEESIEKDAGFATVEESEVGKSTKFQQVEMSEEDMAAQVLIFFFAGFDTISTAMSFTCYELAANTEIQERLRAEVDETIKDHGKLSYDILNKMKYLDMVITETLRKNPPFSAVDRVCTKPYTIQPELPGETPLHLMVGDVVLLPLCGIHSDDKFYPNADKFDPERFSDENKHKVDPYTYLPFGAGPRNCIGSRFALMEVKTLVCHVLQHFELTVISKTELPYKYSKYQFSPAPEGGFWIGFKRRECV